MNIITLHKTTHNNLKLLLPSLMIVINPLSMLSLTSRETVLSELEGRCLGKSKTHSYMLRLYWRTIIVVCWLYWLLSTIFLWALYVAIFSWNNITSSHDLGYGVILQYGNWFYAIFFWHKFRFDTRSQTYFTISVYFCLTNDYEHQSMVKQWVLGCSRFHIRHLETAQPLVSRHTCLNSFD